MPARWASALATNSHPALFAHLHRRRANATLRALGVAVIRRFFVSILSVTALACGATAPGSDGPGADGSGDGGVSADGSTAADQKGGDGAAQSDVIAQEVAPDGAMIVDAVGGSDAPVEQPDGLADTEVGAKDTGGAEVSKDIKSLDIKEVDAGPDPNAPCTPGESVCLSGTVKMYCDNQDTWQKENCAFYDQACVGGQCVDAVCTPNAKECLGDLVIQCDASGAVPKTIEDCAATGQSCADAKCLATICNPYDDKCDADQVYECNDKGTAWDLFDDCPANSQVCVEDPGMGMAMCTEPPCQPNGKGCDGDNLVQCDAVGKWATIKDCAAQNEKCVKELCLAKICTPYDNSCDGVNLMICNDTGTGLDFDTDCSANGEVCVVDACDKPPCVPGALGCDGDEVVQCDNVGGFAKVEDCAAKGMVCEVGKCAAIICKGGDTQCQGDTIFDCNDSGTAFIPGIDCAVKGKFCAAGACVLQLCLPAEIQCNSNDLQMCAGDGKSWQSQSCVKGSYCSSSACLTPKCTFPSSWPIDVQKVTAFDYASLGNSCDWTGDGKGDNVLGGLGGTITTQALAKSIAGGKSAMFLYASAYKTDGGPFAIASWYGALDAVNASCDPTSPNLNCKYKVNPFSYVFDKIGICPSVASMAAATVTAGAMAAGGKGSAATVVLADGLLVLPLTLQNATFKATVTSPVAWTSSNKGVLCGAVSVASVQAAIDNLPAEALINTGLTKAGLKNQIQGALTPDVDLDGDGNKDAYSAAFTLTTAPGTATGIGL